MPKVTQPADCGSFDTERKQVTEVSTTIADSIPSHTRLVAGTTINLSVVQEVTVVKQENKMNDRVSGI